MAELDRNKLFPLPVREIRDNKGNVIVESNSDENSSWWKIKESSRTITQADGNDGGLILSIRNLDSDEWSQTSWQNTPDRFKFGHQVSCHFSDKGPVFNGPMGQISEQEFMRELQVAVAPLQKAGILPPSYMQEVGDVIRQERASHAYSASGRDGALPVQGGFHHHAYAASDGVCSAFWENAQAKAKVYCEGKDGPKTLPEGKSIQFQKIRATADKTLTGGGAYFASGPWNPQDFGGTRPALPDGMQSLPGLPPELAASLVKNAHVQEIGGVVLSGDVMVSVYHLPEGNPHPIAQAVGINAPGGKLKIKR